MRTPILITVIVVSLITVTLAASGLYVWLFACAMLRDPTWKHLITLLCQWQAQTGAAFALAAALVAAGRVVGAPMCATAIRIQAGEGAAAIAADLALTLSGVYAASQRANALLVPTSRSGAYRA